MQNVSQDYLNTITSTNRQYEFYGTIGTIAGNYVFTSNDIVSCEFTQELCSSKLEIGTTCAAELKLGLHLDYDGSDYTLHGQVVDRYVFYDATVNLYFRLHLLNGNTESIQCGVFTVSEPTRTLNILSLVAYDDMLKFNREYNLANTYTPYEYLWNACNECGVILSNSQSKIEAMPNGTAQITPYEPQSTLKTWRTVISKVCELLGGYCVIGNDGKLHVKVFTANPVRVITSGWRFESAVADYETEYGILKHVYLPDNQTDSITVEGRENGLVYEMGGNPFLQISDTSIRTQRLKNIMSYLGGIRYTPFEISVPVDPSLQIGDVIELADGQMIVGKHAAITSISYSSGGRMKLKCVGENPLKSNVYDSSSSYYSNPGSVGNDSIRKFDYVSLANVNVNDGGTKKIMSIAYTSINGKRNEFQGEVLYEIKCNEINNDGNITIGDCEVVLTYKINDVEVEYHPKEIKTDGVHQINLMYFWIANASRSDAIFDVYMKVTGGTAVILANESRGYVECIGYLDIEEDTEIDEDTDINDDPDDPDEPEEPGPTPEDVLTKIKITKSPDKYNYVLGEEYDYTGIEITATFESGNEYVVTNDCTITPAEGTATTSLGTKTVTASYTHNEVTKTATTGIDVKGVFDLKYFYYTHEEGSDVIKLQGINWTNVNTDHVLSLAIPNSCITEEYGFCEIYID